MFSLIITVVSLALVIVLTLAVFYYGGSDTMSKGQDEAHAAKALNEISQIQSAIFSYNVSEGKFPDSLGALVEKNHLKELPEGWSDEESGEIEGLESRRLNIGDTAREALVCELINNRLSLGFEEGFVPSCSDTSIVTPSFRGCCTSE